MIRPVAIALLAAGVSALAAAGGARADEPKPPPAAQASGSEAAAPPEPDPEAELRARGKRNVEAFRTRCETLINDKNYESRETPHYIIETDDPRLEIKGPAALLESFRPWFESFWSGRIDLRPSGEKTFIFLFYSYYKYRQLLSEAEVAGEIRPVGHYMGAADIVAVHTDSVGAGDLPNVLVHEAAHQLVETRIYGPDAEPSPWISEGLATYFGNTLRDKSGKYEAGKIGGKEGVVLFPGAPRSGARTPSEALDEYRRMIKKGTTVPLDSLVSIADPAQFYQGDPRESYAASWLLVHFLLHADGGAHAPAFAAYVRHEIEGKRGTAVFYKDIGMTPEALEEAYKAYVRGL